MTTDTPAKHYGSCLCGVLQFECSGEPIHFNLCHCVMCQKFHGAMLGPYVWFNTDDFKITSGESYEQIYESSDWASRSFCKQCGSSFRYIYRTQPDRVFIAAGVFDSIIPIKPSQHIFVKDKCSWFDILDDSPQIQSWKNSSEDESHAADDRS